MKKLINCKEKSKNCNLIYLNSFKKFFKDNYKKMATENNKKRIIMTSHY